MFERAVEFYGEENMEADLFVGFARFEERQKEVNINLNGNLLHCDFTSKIVNKLFDIIWFLGKPLNLYFGIVD